jgi:U32 family peptidase
MTHSTVEIMAPVGSWESLAAALNAGCHSVYFGVEQLNMRARSTINFTLDDLPRIVERCAPRQVKTYITLNTILYDHDIALAKSIVDRAQQCGVTAVIAADHAVMNYCRRVKMPLHISTQANVSNIDTVEFFSAYADVVVLARELTLRQVAGLTKEIETRQICGPSGRPLAIEMFVHGALCMAVSGKCYISLHSHNASANRGACVQNCRREYVVTDKEDGVELAIDNEYIMSAKDLCTIGFLDKILSSGVSILKIEGRGRSADYVHETVACYREAIEAIQAGTYTEERKQVWMQRLATVYNRGFWDGYYLGQTVGEWNNTYGSKASKKKIYLGKGVKHYGKIGVGEFILENHALKNGDEIMVTGPTTGVIRTTVSEIRVDNIAVDEVGRNVPFSIPIEKTIRPSDKLYRIAAS